MKLYEIPNKSKIKIVLENGEEKMAIYDHPDGMYSYCYLEEDATKVFHLYIATPLEKEADYYVIKLPNEK